MVFRYRGYAQQEEQLTFRRKRRQDDSPKADTRYVVLDGEWTAMIFDRWPIRVASALEVDKLLEQRPVPSIWPDSEEFNSYVGGRDELMRQLWIAVLLRHPNPDVRAQSLRSSYVESNPFHAEVVANLLIDPQVADEAASAVWRMDDNGVRVVLNVVLSRGSVPSGYPPEQRRRAIELLRSTCPQRRTALLERELLGDDHEQAAARLVALAERERHRARTLSDEQQRRRWDQEHLDELVHSGGTSVEWLAGVVEIRAVGHRLNAEGGLSLMQEVARRAGELSEQRMAERYIDRLWDGIGEWRG